MYHSTPTHTYHADVSQVMEQNDVQKHSKKGWRRRIVAKSMDTGHEVGKETNPGLSLSLEEPSGKPAASAEPRGFFTKARQLFRPSSNLPSARNSRSDISDANSGVSPSPGHAEPDGPSAKLDPSVKGSSAGEAGKIASAKVTDPAFACPPSEDPNGLRGKLSQMGREGGFAQVSVAAITNAEATMARVDTITSYLQPLKIFDAFLNTISNIHPYVKIAMGVLSWASQIIISQVNLDMAMSSLLSKISMVYKLLMEEEIVAKLTSMKDTLLQIAQLVRECSQFISNYSETKSFWVRLGKNAMSETDSMVSSYNEALDMLMQQFRDHAIRDIHIGVQHMLEHGRRVHDQIARVEEVVHLEGIAYAAGAGLNTTKKCLNGTRVEILTEIVDWIEAPEPGASRVFWLFGQAGVGKSAIAHTIALRYKELGRLGSCFCFVRDRQAERRHEKLFTTIARDLADRDVRLKPLLADAIANDTSLRTTLDAVQQWQKLILEPVPKLSTVAVGNVVIVIDALDESGSETTREHILNILASTQIAELPPNFRILITSRPLPDIRNALHNAEHTKIWSMDTISTPFTERDIRLFVADKLQDLDYTFPDDDLALLAKKSDGLFEWARLACEFIKSQKGGVTAQERFDDLISHPSEESGMLLDDMYRVILRDIIDKSTKARQRFRSVMRQILWTLEPLPVDSLNAMRRGFPQVTDHYDVQIILRPMASLLSGVTKSSVPVRPLHSSFYDFLTDPDRSQDFFVDLSQSHLDLSLASLRIMREGLHFNICQLDSSYLRNSEIGDLDQRVRSYISPHLSYSCRHWTSHVRACTFDSRLVSEVGELFNDVRILFWIETLSLLNGLNAAPGALLAVAKWLETNEERHTFAVVIDVLKFIRMFGGAISESTPHLYLSALPFLPTGSLLHMRFSSMFSRIARVASGGPTNWPKVQVSIRGHTSLVLSVAFFPDGNRILSGSYDRTIRIWDAETGLQLGRSLEGHQSSVTSVAVSPDGKRIASGSFDNTVRVWEAQKGVEVAKHCGHADPVLCVAFSPDGERIVSSSKDGTICVWDREGGLQLYWSLPKKPSVNAVAFSPDGGLIASGSSDTALCIWDAKTGSQVGKACWGHLGPVLSVAFSPDGRRVVSASSDHTLRLWNLETCSQVGRLSGHSTQVSSVSWSSDGQRIVSGSNDYTVRVWNAETGKPVDGPMRGHTGLVNSVAFSPDGKRIVSGSSDHTLHVWDTETISPTGDHRDGFTGLIYSVCFSCDGSRILSGIQVRGKDVIRTWDAETGLQAGDDIRGHRYPITAIKCSSDGTRIVSASVDCTMRLWDARTGLQIGKPLSGHSRIIYSMQLSSDGKRIVSCSEDFTIRIWDSETGSQIGEPLDSRPALPFTVATSPNGRLIASGSNDYAIRLWDSETRSEVCKPLAGHTHWVASVAFSPDGKHIASGSYDHTVRIWDADTATPQGDPLYGHSNSVYCVVFSPDGSLLASSSGDTTIRLWNTTTWSPAGVPLKGHAGRVMSVAFSNDGKRLLSFSTDNTIRVWDIEPFTSHSAGCATIQLSRSSHTPATYPICFSSLSEHTLCDSDRLFDGATVERDWRELVQMERDGWIVGPEGRLLLWVPVTCRALLRSLRSLVIPRSDMELDLSDMAHGNAWQHCFQTSCH